MGIIFSNKCELAIKSVLYLSLLDKDNKVSVKDLSEKMDIYKEFSAKVLQELAASGIVSSKKGKNGGFYLSRELNDITLLEIVQAIDGDSMFKSCLFGFSGCGSCIECPVHDKWGGIRQDLYDLLANRTLADMRSKTEKKLLEMILGDSIKVPTWGCQA